MSQFIRSPLLITDMSYVSEDGKRSVYVEVNQEGRQDALLLEDDVVIYRYDYAVTSPDEIMDYAKKWLTYA